MSVAADCDQVHTSRVLLSLDSALGERLANSPVYALELIHFSEFDEAPD